MMPKGIFVRTKKHRLANSKGQLGKKMSFENHEKKGSQTVMKKLQYLTTNYINPTFTKLGMVKRPRCVSSWGSNLSVTNTTNIVKERSDEILS